MDKINYQFEAEKINENKFLIRFFILSEGKTEKFAGYVFKVN